MNKTKLIIVGAAAMSLVASVFINLNYDKQPDTTVVGAGGDFADSKWFIVNKFQGYQTKADATKITIGGNPNGQNTIINDGDRISIRPYGYEVLGTSTTTGQRISSLHTFRKRSGENILIRAFGTSLQYYEEGNDTWEYLSSTLTSGAEFGFADYNINTDLRSYVYMGNAVDPFMRWSGAHTTSTVAIGIGDSVINVTDAQDFPASGTLLYCGNSIAYTSHTNTVITLTGTTAAICPVDRGIAEAVTEYSTYPRGNIYLIANNRVFIAGVTSTPQAVYFSKYGDAATWLTTLVSDSTADAAGIFNLGEGGGAVTGMVLDEGAIYIFKKSITYKAILSDSLYSLSALKPFDGKSQTTGAANSHMVFSGGNGIIFITPDKQIMNLSRVDYIDYPQITPISDPIKPTIEAAVMDAGDGILWRNNAYISVKSTDDSSTEDTIFLYNTKIQSWESPIIGWSASRFAIYDDGTGEALYFGDANVANTYKVIDTERLDQGMGFTASWRSKQFDFSEMGLSTAELKEVNNVWVEGYIEGGTELNVSLLLDEDGFTQSFTTTIDGNNTDYVFSTSPFNLFGLNPFGYMRFGTNDAMARKKFRVYLNRDFRAYPFYNAQLEFTSETDNADWEITAFGFKVREATQTEKQKLYKAFK